MAIGGWSPPQYLAIYEKALTLQPQAVVIGIYLGNDILEAFRVVYSHSYWENLRHRDISLEDAPTTPFPFPQSELLPLKVNDKDSMVFTPAGRLRTLDQSNRANKEGVRLILECMKQIALKAQATNTPTYFLLIPTKELVYKELITQYNKEIPQDMESLWEQEQVIHDLLVTEGDKLKPTTILSTLPALRKSARQDLLTYPPDKDGHPLSQGYQVIAQTSFDSIKDSIHMLSDGLYQTTIGDNTWYYEIKDRKRRLFRTKEALKNAGFDSSHAHPATLARLQTYPLMQDYH